MFNKLQLSAVPVLIMSSSLVNAASVSYFTEADFLAALSGYDSFTHDFDAMTSGSLITDGSTIDGATFSYDFGGPSIMVDNYFTTTSADNYLGTNDGSGAFYGGDSLTLTFDHGMRAIGMYVISADIIMADDFTITTSAGQTVSNVTTADVSLIDGDAFFIGLIEDDASLAFNSISFSSMSGDYLFNIDDVTVSAIPVPAAIWLFGTGLLSLLGVARFRR